MRYGLIGEHLGHSFSALVHPKLGSAPYELRELQPDELAGFLRSRDFDGINVTIPYKKAVIPHLDFLSDEARELGAVNTVVRSDDGVLTGHNTDFGGFIDMAGHSGIDFRGRRVVVLGAGGAGMVVAAAARRLGASQVQHAVRNPREQGQLRLSEPGSFADAQIIINATPVGMFPEVDATPLPLDAFNQLEGVLDCIYNPLRSNLVLDALERGVKAEGGLYMLVAQAVRASELFQGRQLPEGATEAVYNEILRDKQNIVLVGMPSCGKTTIGRILAARLGREFIDTDSLIVERVGKPITEIFASEGEVAFRDMEAAVIEEAALRQGVVIATGGGSVKRDSNVRALRRSGRVYFIRRSLDALQATADRPLSSDRAALERLWAERLPLYEAAADETLDYEGDFSETDIVRTLGGAFGI